MPYNLIAATNESTVVAEYTPKGQRSDSYQSEAALEAEFIRLLQAQGYEYLAIHSEKELIANLRRQLELLNGYQFSDSEWERFCKSSIAGANDGIVEKPRRIQADHVQVLRQDSGARDTRYDVTILVNGLPLVHVELKRRGVAIREAFNQIKRYQRDSFWAASGLYEYVQIFVISNGTHTKYYSNTTRISHIKEMGEARNKSKKTGNSFEFTSFWADGSNKVIANLVDFTKTFFSRHTLLSILTRYCIFTSEELLMVMRPYQIAATERILHVSQYTAEEFNQLLAGDGQAMLWAGIGSVDSAVGIVGVPIFAYLLVQGVEHTSNLQRYILTVLAFAAISEVPYDLAMFGQVWNWSEQNSLWTAFIALVMLWLMKNFRGKGMVPTVLGTVFAAGGCFWAILYLLRERKGASYGLGALVSLIYATAPLGFVPVALCGGERRDMGRTKYAYYVFYPIMLALFALWGSFI